MLKKWWENFRRKIKKCYRTKDKIKDEIYDDGSVQSWIAPLVLAISIGLFYAAYANYEALPKPLTIDSQKSHPDRFIAENAQQYLKQLTSLGVRVGGSAVNDIQTVNTLETILNEFANQVNTSLHTLKVFKQNAEGDFQLEFKPYGMTTVYRGVMNVIAQFGPRVPTSNKCLLLNSHFDTMPDTAGASDAGAMIAVMLEVLRVLVNSQEEFRHCVIFLFNGGEENYMLGSHAFITQHELAPSVASFINLDSAGSGGREILFQGSEGHSWQMNYYRRYAQHPMASVMAEELFQAELIPSDSDFRIFRDFGNIPGMDFAFNANGYVYHTKYDVDDIIPMGTLQHTGDNILALTKALANSDELFNVTAYKDDNVVFYDVLNWFLLYYTMQDAMIINLTICGMGVIVIAFSLKSMSQKSGLSIGEMLVEFMITFGCHLVGVGFGVGITFLLAVIYDACNRSMSWFTSSWLLFGLYFCPFLFTLAIPAVIWVENFKRGLLSTSHQVQLYLHSQFLLTILMLVPLTFMHIRSAYLLLISVVFYLVTAFINWISGLQNKPRAWMIVHLLGQVVPILFYGSMLHLALQTFIPITGRDGPDTNPDILIAIFSIGMALFMGGLLTPLVAICSRPKLVLSMLPLLWIISIIIMFTPVGFPYRAETNPQRYWVYHTQRTFNGPNNTIWRNESGYFLLAMDRHTPRSVLDILPNNIRGTEGDCEEALYCGLPLLSSRKHSKSEQSFWIPTDEPPNLPNKDITNFGWDVVNSSSTTRTYKFKLTGPNHMAVYLSPFEDMTVVEWSLIDNVIPESGPRWQNDRETYFIFFNYGFNANPTFEFTVTVHSANQMMDADGTQCLDVAFVTHYLFHTETRTAAFQRFIDDFPEWTYVQAWSSSYESWTV